MNEMTTPEEVRSVLLPLHGGFLLLPNAAVSEVIGYRDPEPLDEQLAAPDWLMGQLQWRELQVPLVSFEQAIGQERGDAEYRARIAICNTLTGNTKLPFVAIQLKSAPHLVRVTEENVSLNAPTQSGQEAILSQVLVNGQEAWIPNVDYLEKTILEITS